MNEKMSALIITGNSEFYQVSNRYTPEEYLVCIPTLSSVELPTLNLKNQSLTFLEDTYFEAFLTATSRGDILDVALNHTKYGLDQSFLNLVASMNAFQNNMLKTLLISTFWLNRPIKYNSPTSVKSLFYDTLTINDRGWAGKTDNIYYIKEELQNEFDESIFEILIKVNLLVRFKASMGEYKFMNYAIPLLKVGVNESTFNTLGSKGKKAYRLWREIISNRNRKISELTNNRTI